MPILRKLIIQLPLALMFLIVVSSASAAASMTTTKDTVRQSTPKDDDSDKIKTEIVRGTVKWTLPAGQCSSLPAGVAVSGTGQRFQVITTRKNENGSTQIFDNDFVQGTAVDSAQRTYHFIYANQTRRQVPHHDSPIKVNMTDSFILTDDAGSTTVVVAFVWRWTFTPPAELWPPADHWKKDYTQGDPFTCDPI